MKKRELNRALALAKRLLSSHPKNEVLLNTLSIVYRRKGRFREAEVWAKKALEIKRDFWAAHNNLARIYHDQGSLKESINYYRWVLEKNPNYIQARSNFALALKSAGDFKGSLSEYRKLIKVSSSNIVRYHLGVSLITLSTFIEGWRYYEYRWYADTNVNVQWPFDRDKMWKGEEGGELVLWREQGIGDDILFLGMVPEAKRKVDRLSVYVDPRLVPLCKRSMRDIEFIPSEEKLKEKKFDYHLPMGSLPLHFRNSEKDFSETVNGYLKADEKRVEALRDELGIKGKRVIGISWKSFNGSNMENKNLNLKDLANLFKDLDITLVNLQYGDVEDEIREFTQSTGINVLQCGSVDNRDDLDGLAALIELCDLVVSTSNVTIHLAGALGKETWVLLPYVSKFWWLLDREDSVWYPSIRLYRQSSFKSWARTLTKVQRDINAWAIDYKLNAE